MAEILFKAKAEYDEVVKMRKEIERLNAEIEEARKSGNKKVYENLNKELEDVRKKYNKATESAAKNAQTETIAGKTVESTKRRVTAARLKDVAAQRASTSATRTATASSITFNGVLKALFKTLVLNPFTIVAGAVLFLGTSIYKMITAASAAELANESLRKSQERMKEATDNERSSVDSLMRVLRDETATRAERQMALDELQRKYPDIFKNLDLEKVKYMDITEVLRLVNEELEKKNKLQLSGEISEAESVLKRMQDGVVSVKDRKEATKILGIGFWESIYTDGVRLTEAMGKHVDGLKEKETELMVASYNAASSEEKLNRALIRRNELQERYDKLQKTDTTWGGDFAKQQELKQLEKELNGLNEEIKVYGENVQGTSMKNRAYWEAELKAARAVKDALTDESTEQQWKDAQARIDAAEAKLDRYSSKKTEKPSAPTTMTSTGYNIPAAPDMAKIIDEIKKFNELRRKANEEGILEERAQLEQARRDYLLEWGNFAERRNALIDKFKEDSKGKNQYERAGLLKQLEKDLQALSSEEVTSGIFEKLFGDVGRLSSETIKNLLEKAENVNTDGWSPERIEAWKNAVLKARDELENRNPFDALTSGWKEFVAALKSGDSDAIKGAIDKIEVAVQGAMQYLNDIGIGSFGSDSTKETVDGIMSIVGGTAQAGVGLAKLSSGDIIGGLKNLAQGISNVVSGIVRVNDAAKEREIVKLQEKVEKLRDAYDDLADKIEEAFSSDAANLIRQNNELLKQQQIAIKQQIAQEKAKKKTDKDRIKAWEKEYEEINKLIAENEKAAHNAIIGEDIMASIDRFADAYANAWASGADKRETARGFIKDMLRQMIVDAMKADISEPMNIIRQKMEQFWADGKITAAEEDELNRLSEQLFNSLDKKYEWADRILTDKVAEEQGAASRGGYETISQGTGTELLGVNKDVQLRMHDLVNIAGQIATIKALEIENMFERDAVLNGIAKNVALITGYTAVLPEMKDTLVGIKKGTDRL